MALRKVYLYGDLAEKYGEVFEFDVTTFAECVRALKCAFPDFYTTIRPHEYALFRGNKPSQAENIGEIQIGMNLGAGAFHIVPKVFGASATSRIFNSGVGSFIAGAALTVVGVITVNPFLIAAGVGLMVGGAMMMLMSNMFPDVPEGEDPRNSHLFSNAQNSVKQGEPIPICYGQFLIGSTVVSGSLSIEDLSDTYSVTHTILGANYLFDFFIK